MATFSQVLSFAAHEEFSRTTQTGPLTFTPAASGNVRNSSYRVEIIPSFAHPITAPGFVVRGFLKPAAGHALVLNFTWFTGAFPPVCVVTQLPL